jgi:hypothetical protein
LSTVHPHPIEESTTLDQQATYRAGGKAGPNTVSGPWELLPVKSDHGTYLFRFNLTTGDCYSLDLRNIGNGWVRVPSGAGTETVISDAGVTAGHAKGEKGERVTAGSI